MLLPPPPPPRRPTPPPRVYHHFGGEQLWLRCRELDLQIRDEAELLRTALAGWRDDQGAAVVVVPEHRLWNMVDKIDLLNTDGDPSFCFPITTENYPLGGRPGRCRALIPSDLHPEEGYTVIVTSFEYLASEVDAMNRFRADCMYHKAGHSDLVPERPELVLLDPIWWTESDNCIGWVLTLADYSAFQFLSLVELRYYLATLGLVV
ncbi:hypothetical protein ACHAPU_002531 [Fusarium lateritium]